MHINSVVHKAGRIQKAYLPAGMEEKEKGMKKQGFETAKEKR